MLFRGTRAREIPPKADNIVDPLTRDRYFKRKPFQSKVKSAARILYFNFKHSEFDKRYEKKTLIVKHLNYKILLLIRLTFHLFTVLNLEVVVLEKSIIHVKFVMPASKNPCNH